MRRDTNVADRGLALRRGSAKLLRRLETYSLKNEGLGKMRNAETSAWKGNEKTFAITREQTQACRQRIEQERAFRPGLAIPAIAVALWLIIGVITIGAAIML